MKKTIKIMSILLVTIMFVAIFATNVNATSADTILNQMSNVSYTDGGIANVGKNIVSILSTIGVVVAVIILLVIGIKYMVGSASEKAEYKKTMIPYLVGAVLIFGASAIAKVVVSMAQTITTT